jgi:hypothetical protein
MIYILDTLIGKLVKAEILVAERKDAPSKRDGWNFNWIKLIQEENSHVYFLKTIESPKSVEGALQLKIENGMLIMELLEIAPHNIGQENKKYDHVAGCLIAFACRESIKIDGVYMGFLTFVSKTNLIEWYTGKYGAVLALGHRMYIDYNSGLKLIKEYLERK